MLGTVWRYIKETGGDFWEDNALSRGAAISFYTILSLGPVLVLCIAIAGFAFGEEAARGAIVDQLRGLMGKDSAELIQSMIASAGRRNGGVWPSIIGIVTLLVTATSVFAELQAALNFIWKAEPQSAGVGGLLKARAAGLGLVASLAFLLLVSLVVGAALQAVSSYMIGVVPAAKTLLVFANVVLSFLIVSALFAAIYKILPDRQLVWRDVAVGALVTALLFTVGKSAIAYYLGAFSVSSSYGAAGTLIVVMLWIYYSCEIFLFGAEFTKVWAAHHGSREAFEARELKVNETPPKTVIVHRPRSPMGWLDIAALAAIVIAAISRNRRSGLF